MRGLEALRELACLHIQELRLGTTVATNALLERGGSSVALVTTEGFTDLLRIRDQRRPDLFRLDARRRAPLTDLTLGVPRGVAWAEGALRRRLMAWRERGVSALAVALLFAHRDPEAELRVERIAREAGFDEISLSHRLSSRPGLLARAETCVLDAYLSPVLSRHLAQLDARLGGVPLTVMTSAGVLVEPARVRGVEALLSGPAGGVVGVHALANTHQLGEVVGLDMGGTSTDVCRVEGELPLVREAEVDGHWVRTPTLAIHTIAAGGGSVCRFDGELLRVGPDSVGAEPGPLSYGRPEAHELSLTDVALALGRVRPERFPLPLAPDRAREELTRVAARVSETGQAMDWRALAQGFFDVAVEAMAGALRRVSVGRGYDLREHTLIPFGAAAGQYACAVARLLGIRRLLHHPLAGVLSAYGIGLASRSWQGEINLGALPLSDHAQVRVRVAEGMETLALRGEGALPAEPDVAPALSFRLGLGYAGSDTTLDLPVMPLETSEARFHALHERRFGYAAKERGVEARTLHLTRSWESTPPTLQASIEQSTSARGELFVDGQLLEVPLVRGEAIVPSSIVQGPMIVLEASSTFVLERGFSATRRADGALLVEQIEESTSASPERIEGADPVSLEVFERRFASIADEMGAVLQRTAGSTNIRERLDFSCAVFDGEGSLIANAPHIPVHLGSMGETVQALHARHPEWAPGEVYASNAPSLGGTHLPDITVVSAVFCGQARPQFFVASRGHHEDVGGISPGSMPVDSKCLSDEGIVFEAFLLVREGVLRREALMERLGQGPHPARNPRMNLADLEAAVAANQHGIRSLEALAEERGLARVRSMMAFALDHGEAAVRRALTRLPEGEHRFDDAMDDGARIALRLVRKGASLALDFEGTSPEVAGNLNAPWAITVAALLYVLRVLVDEELPLNAGCLRPVSVHIPSRSLLSPGPDRAVAAGNVETSQRVVDVLLGAFGLAAASQGTMNNLSFGDASFGYYETLGGGAGAGPSFDGGSGVHTHMTNSRITDPEVLEARFPVRVRRFELRRGSGGAGRHHGGDGLVREFELLAPLDVSLLTERRVRAPYGLQGGEPGAKGRNLLNGKPIPGRVRFSGAVGDLLRIETPGGGGYGAPRG